MRVIVIGANGRTGFLITRKLAEGKHEPVAMIRDKSQSRRFEELGVETVVGDLEHPIDDQVRGCDAVIFAAGSGAKTGKDKTILIDHLGGIKAAVAAAVSGARRFIMLSSLNADPQSKSGIMHYHRAKAHADNFIRDQENVMEQTLGWTIVCPGRLTDEKGTGLVRLSKETHGKGETSRENVAETIVTCLDTPETINQTFGLLDGNEEISEALKSLSA